MRGELTCICDSIKCLGTSLRFVSRAASAQTVVRAARKTSMRSWLREPTLNAIAGATATCVQKCVKVACVR